MSKRTKKDNKTKNKNKFSCRVIRTRVVCSKVERTTIAPTDASSVGSKLWNASKETTYLHDKMCHLPTIHWLELIN